MGTVSSVPQQIMSMKGTMVSLKVQKEVNLIAEGMPQLASRIKSNIRRAESANKSNRKLLAIGPS